MRRTQKPPWVLSPQLIRGEKQLVDKCRNYHLKQPEVEGWRCGRP
jgi:hypothetical protein